MVKADTFPNKKFRQQ